MESLSLELLSETERHGPELHTAMGAGKSVASTVHDAGITTLCYPYNVRPMEIFSALPG